MRLLYHTARYKGVTKNKILKNFLFFKKTRGKEPRMSPTSIIITHIKPVGTIIKCRMQSAECRMNGNTILGRGGVAKRRERNEWHHGVMSERERDRAAARTRRPETNGGTKAPPYEHNYNPHQTCRGRRPRRPEKQRYIAFPRRWESKKRLLAGRRGRRPLRCMIRFVCFAA